MLELDSELSSPASCEFSELPVSVCVGAVLPEGSPSAVEFPVEEAAGGEELVVVSEASSFEEFPERPAVSPGSPVRSMSSL